MSASADSSSFSITARPEDVLLACVAYRAPEMLSLDNIISLHSQGKLTVHTSAEHAKSIAHLPTELLLRIRADLQTALFDSIKREAAQALEEYQSALVEGICQDCFWWNFDVYDADVWAWVENGYRTACNCPVVGDVDPRTPSQTKLRALKKFEGLDIGTRGQWLRAYIERTYLSKNTTAWRFARGVLAEFGCTHRFERALSTCVPASLTPMQSGNASAAMAAGGEPESKKTPPRTTSCDFGALVRISQLPERCEIEDPAITIGRLLRELDLKAPADDEPSIPQQSTAAQFVDEIHRRAACARHFLEQRGPAGTCMDCLAIFAAPAMSFTSYAFASSRSFSTSSRLSSLISSAISHRTLTSLVFGAASVAYLVARVVL